MSLERGQRPNLQKSGRKWLETFRGSPHAPVNKCQKNTNYGHEKKCPMTPRWGDKGVLTTQPGKGIKWKVGRELKTREGRGGTEKVPDPRQYKTKKRKVGRAQWRNQ